jgi:uncharacterized protein YfdQ (DUF2303 family)
MEQNESNAVVVERLTVAALQARADGPDAKPYVVLPPCYKIEDIEDTLKAPMRAKGTVTLRTQESFIDMVNAHKDAGTKLYGMDGDKPSFTAVFNDNDREVGPGWQDHKAFYGLPLSKEWQVWTGADAKAMNQTAFAKFIEDNLPDVVEPAAAEMLVISRTLEAKKNVEFKSGQRLSNGEQEFTYNETIESTAGKGALKVPEEFAIGIPVFNGGTAYKVTARLRYRIDGGKLVLWYELLRAHKVMEDAFKTVREEIEKGVGMKAFIGSN